MVWPSGPVWASRWPSSGLAAADWTLARPSGNRTVFLSSAPGFSRVNGPTSTTTTATRRGGEAPRLPLAVPDVEQGEGHGHGGPRGGLHRRRDAQGQAGRDRVRPGRYDRAVRHSSAKPRQRKATMGTSVAADAQLEGDDRRGGQQQGPAHAVPGSGHPQREGEHDQEHDPEPDPRVGQRVVTEQRLGQAEEGHQRQVGVVHVGVDRAGQRLDAPVRGAVPDQGLSRAWPPPRPRARRGRASTSQMSGTSRAPLTRMPRATSALSAGRERHTARTSAASP